VGTRRFAFWFFVMSGSLGWAQGAPERPIDDVTILPAFSVKGDRMEDLGLRLHVLVGIPTSINRLSVAEVFPNTAAAKAGLRPGEWIDMIDGKSVGLGTLLSIGFKPQKLQDRMWAELARGKASVTLSLEVRAPRAKESRTVILRLPSAGPRWGSEKWSPPEGRAAAVVKEAGPLAGLAREILDNGIWSGSYDHTGYEWRIVQLAGGRRIWVSQPEGRTEIRLEHRSPETGRSEFSTSPSGAMDKARCEAPKIDGKRREFSAEEIRAQFAEEIDFWLHKVGRVTGHWPFEALSGETAVITSVGHGLRSSPSPAPATSGPGKNNAPQAESFPKLPAATAEQKRLFSDALGKIGLDAEGWAFTETSRSPADDHVTTVRFDPSKPPAERSTLLKVDGKDPKPAYLQQWRNEGHGPLPGLGELPPLSSVVAGEDARIYADETAAVLFELPVKAANTEFPPDKFLARFRVNKTSRGFEDFSVKLREAMSVAGIAKVTDAGFEARFQTFDPALAPQPVGLKMGGGVRVLLVKFSRSFEVTRTDFKRVEPFDEAAVQAK